MRPFLPLIAFLIGFLLFGFFVGLICAFVVHGLARPKKVWPKDDPGRELDDRGKPWKLLESVNWEKAEK